MAKCNFHKHMTVRKYVRSEEARYYEHKMLFDKSVHLS